MPRYFFHLLEASDTAFDEEGRELASLEMTRQQALVYARDIMAAEVLNGRIPLAPVNHIERYDGLKRLEVPFSEAVQVSA
jgi:hypothetical protein